jgi:molecular chaperone IbpA
MRGSFDFAPFRRSAVGFDRLFEMLESSAAAGAGENYPPFDLIREGEHEYRIEIAVAGFRREEIEITSHQNVLIIRGRKGDGDGADYIHRGIATRSFERRFALADHVQVSGADLADGMLAITLRREIPEAMKPRRIEIGGTVQPRHDRIDAGAKAGERQGEDA